MKKFSTTKKIVFYIFVALIFFVSVGLASFFIIRYKKSYANLPTVKDLYKSWNEKDYIKTFDQSKEILKRRPYDYDILALQGFAAYYLSSAQTSQNDASFYIDDCIVSLRKALYNLSQKDLPRVYYILGKAYFQKGHFYYDLAVKYLDRVIDLGMKFPDINKFRGMAFSYLGDDQKAIDAFTQDLVADSDEFLLYALAKNYINIGNFEKAKMYLTEAIEKANDVLVKLNCKAKLADVYLEEGKLEKAREEYKSILKINEKYSDAYYGLGLVYEKAGDLVLARAEWRNALKANPLNEKAIEKLK